MSEFKLIKEVINISESNNWDDAIKEWKIFDVVELEKREFEQCLCGKYPIKQVIKLNNKNNNREINVGNCCVNKFFGIKDYNKVFVALRKNKINNIMIEETKNKDVINEWEYNFIKNVWRKRKLTQKQEYVRNKIKKKIISHYKKKERGVKHGKE